MTPVSVPPTVGEENEGYFAFLELCESLGGTGQRMTIFPNKDTIDIECEVD